MKTLLPFLVPMSLAAAAVAQSSDSADLAIDVVPVEPGYRKVRAVGTDGDATMRPVLLQRNREITVVGQPHATVAVFLGMRATSGDTDIGPVQVLLGSGQLGADGELSVPIYWFDILETAPLPILAQAMQRRADGKVDTSPILELRRPDADADRHGTAAARDGDGYVDGDVFGTRPVLKIHNELPASLALQAELLETGSIPPQYHLHFAVEVPTSGYSLQIGAPRREGGRTLLAIEVVQPDPDMRHLTVLETLRAFVELGSEPGDVELTVRRTAFADGTKGRDVLK